MADLFFTRRYNIELLKLRTSTAQIEVNTG